MKHKETAERRLVMRCLRGALLSGSTEEAIGLILQELGQALYLERISIFSTEGDYASVRFEWGAPGVVPCARERQGLLREDIYALLLRDESLKGQPVRAFLEPDARAVASRQDIKFLSLPLLSGAGHLGYLVAEGSCVGSFRADYAEAPEELSPILATLLMRALQEREQRQQLAVLSAVCCCHDGMLCVHDPQSQQLLFASQGLDQALSVPADELRGAALLEKFCKIYGGSHEKEGLTRREFFHEETGRWYLARRSCIRWVDGREACLDRLLDISERKTQEAALLHLASTDGLTGAYQRDWGYRQIEALLAKGAQALPATLVFLDIDKLKCVNDRFGHSQGDRIICETVQMIRQCIRKSDLICRWGGDEFVLLIHADLQESERIMQKIRTKLQEKNKKQPLIVSRSFSYGLAAIFPESGCCVEDLLAEADRRMYAQKEEANGDS